MLAWPSAEIQIIASEPAARILYRREIESADDPEAVLNAKAMEYHDNYTTPFHSSARSVVDAIIRPEDTRRMLISALRMLETKSAPERVRRKHGNIPL